MEKYLYCSVRFKGIHRTYSYICDTPDVIKGSFVEVPFGRVNLTRMGEVVCVSEHTWEDAPYPPELTKHVIRVVSAEEYVNPIIPDERTRKLREYEKQLYEVYHYIEKMDYDNMLAWAQKHHYCTDCDAVMEDVVRCYEYCIDFGIPEAAYGLGSLYYTGKGIEQDYSKAYYYYKIAADCGNRRAICGIGYCWYYGRHQPADYDKAYEYFNLGVQLFNDANCLYKIGDMYYNGYRVEPNSKYAYTIYERAYQVCISSEDDYYSLPDVCLRIGKCYLYGIGVMPDGYAALEMLLDALKGFYARKAADPFCDQLIEETHECIGEAEELLKG